MNCKSSDLYECEPRIAAESSNEISCEFQVDCGCTVIAPFSFFFQGLTAAQGSSLGDTAAERGTDHKIVLKDGLGLVQMGDVGKVFTLVAFGGDEEAYESYASQCRNTERQARAPQDGVAQW